MINRFKALLGRRCRNGGDGLELRLIWVGLLVTGLIFAGSVFRWRGLRTHFSHIDDLGVALSILEHDSTRFAHHLISSPYLTKILEVPRSWTYAPMQFLVTPLLLHKGQSYSDILFWGRLPSYLFGVGGLLAMALTLLKIDRRNYKNSLIFTTCLFAFSWENIIYSTQMQSFSIGVLGILFMILLFLNFIKDPVRTPGRIGGMIVLLVMLSNCQYQLMFLVPAFLLVVFLAAVEGQSNPGLLVRRYFLGGLGYVFLMTPTFLLFLRGKSGAGINWNAGPSGEYLFYINKAGGLIQNALYTFQFFFKNGLQVVQSNLSFTESHSVGTTIFYLLTLVTMSIGLFSLLTSMDKIKIQLGRFFILVAFSWIALVILGKITFGPTRHSLILLPIMIILIAEGFSWAFCRLGMTSGYRETAAFLVTDSLGLVVLTFFVMGYSTEFARRVDPFDPALFSRVIAETHSQAIVCADYTWNPSLLDLPGYEVLEHRELRILVKRGASGAFGHGAPVIFLSHRGPLSQMTLDQIASLCSTRKLKLGSGVGYPAIEDLKINYLQYKQSSTEIDFSNATHNGSNGMFLAVCWF